MFVQTWNKYLPVIKILLKRSAGEVQNLDMNQTDFERAAGGRKVKYTFSLLLHKGRIQNIESPVPLAREFVNVLLSDDVTNPLIRQQDFEFTMNGNFQLSIKNVTPQVKTDIEPEIQTDEANSISDHGQPEPEGVPDN